MLVLSKRAVIKPITDMCREHPTVEVTGMVIRGKDGDRVRFMRNLARRPEVYYEWDPEEMADVWTDMDRRGEEPIAFFHSHPNGRMDPSERDMEGALLEGMYHLIMAKHLYGWNPYLYECIEAGILVSAQLEVVT